jgi:DNA polymerase III subunit epsilon
MKPRLKLLLAVAALTAYFGAALALFGFEVWSGLRPGERTVVDRVLSDHAAFAIVLAVLFVVGLGSLLAVFFRVYVTASRRLAEETRIIGSVNASHRIEPKGASEMRELAAAVNELGRRYQELEAEVERRLRVAAADLREEGDRLAAVMAELTQPVLVCNHEGQIVLYNDAARRLDGAERLIGLGRSVFGLVDREVVRHALTRAAHGDRTAPVRCATTTAQGGLVRMHLAPVRAREAELEGFLLAFDDVIGGEDGAPVEQADELRANDLVSVLVRTLEGELGLRVQVEQPVGTLWLAVESRSLVEAVTDLAKRLQDACGVDQLGLELHLEGPHACLDIGWNGRALDLESVRSWAGELAAAGQPLELSSRTDGEAGTASLRVRLPLAGPAIELDAPATSPSRPVFYDFDLFDAARRRPEWDARLLAELSYSVFDVETTGLDPTGGDEILSLGAVRIVNGRLLRQEAFDQLVDPRRLVAVQSLEVHGISREMTHGQPTIEEVLPRFAQFVEGSVLLGHNVAFDLRFLELKEVATGVRLRNPALDTLLLSAVVHPNQEDHSLEAIAERVGVSVLGRHTALGDAILTAEIFLKLIPLLAAEGVLTLEDALEASRRTGLAKVDY